MFHLRVAGFRFFRRFCLVALCGTVLLGTESLSRITRVSADDSADDTKIVEQTIYVPYDKLRETFEREGRGVYLPYEDFQKLWESARAAKPMVAPAEQPVAAVITQIESRAVVEATTVRVTATVHVDLLKEGWISVPLGLKGAAVLSATHNQQPARLITEEDGRVVWLVHRPTGSTQDASAELSDDRERSASSESSLTNAASQPVEPQSAALEVVYAKTFTKAPGRNSVEFDAPRAAVNRWRIQVPDKGVKIEVQPMLATSTVPEDALAPVEPSEEENESPSQWTAIDAFVGAADQVQIAWTPKSEGASGLEALVEVEMTQTLVINAAVLRTRADLAYEISRAGVSELSFAVPRDEKVVRVTDSNVKQWTVTERAEDQLVTVQLYEPALTQQQIVLEMERYYDWQESSSITLPQITVQNVGRQQGTVLVIVSEDLRAEPAAREGLVPVDRSTVTATPTESQAVQPLRQMAYRYETLPINLEFALTKVEPRLDVTHLVEGFLEPEQLTVTMLARCDIQQAGIFEIETAVPAGFEVVKVEGRAVGDAAAVEVTSFTLLDGPLPQLQITLSKRAIGVVGLYVELRKSLDLPALLSPTGESAEVSWELPRVVTPEPHRTTMQAVVLAPESLRVSSGAQVELRSTAVQEAYSQLPTARDSRWSQMSPVLAFVGAEKAAAIRVDAERRQPQVTVQQLTIVDVETGVVKFRTTLHYEIRYSGVPELRLDVPSDLVTRIQNDATLLRNSPIEPAPEDVDPQYVAWKLQLDRELLGKYQFSFYWETPLDGFGIGQSVEIPIPRLIPRNVDRSEGQIVIRRGDSIEVQPLPTVQGVEPIDPEHDLMPGFAAENAAWAMEYHGDWSATLKATRYQLEALKQTSIERAVIRAVVTRSDLVTIQALYRMRTNLQRLQIVLPDEVSDGHIAFDSQPLKINGVPVGLEQGDDRRTFYAPLVGNYADSPFVLELRYSVATGKSITGATISYPQFADDAAIQEVALVPYLPDDNVLVGSQGPWSSENQWRARQWWDRRLVPTRSVQELIASVTRDISIASNPSEDFPVDGDPLLFTALRPGDPASSSLQLNVVHRNAFQAIVVGITLLIGMILLRYNLAVRIAVIALVALIVLIGGMFFRTAQFAFPQGTFAASLLAVAGLWAIVGTVRTSKRIERARAARRASRVETPNTYSDATRASADSPPPTSGDPPPNSVEPPSNTVSDAPATSSDDTSSPHGGSNNV